MAAVGAMIGSLGFRGRWHGTSRMMAGGVCAMERKRRRTKHQD
jgi:hypothetical protein